jgi:WD40 repeat protein
LPDGRYLATSGTGQDRTARLWNAQTGQELRQFVGHTGCACGVVFSPDGQYLLTSSDDRTVRMWDVETGQELRRFAGHADSLFDATFSPDGRSVVSGSYDKTARLWDIATGHEIKQFIGHTGGVGPVTFSPDGRYVLTGSQDRTARLWDIWAETEPQHTAAFIIGYGPGFQAGTLSSDGQYALYGSVSGAMSLQDIATGEMIQQLGLDKGTINAQALSAGTNYVLTGGGDSEARLWDIASGQEVGRFSGHDGPIWAVAFSPDDHLMLTGSEDNTARLWDVETGQERRQYTGHTASIKAVAFSSDGRLVLTGSEDTTARLWEAQTGQELARFVGHTGPIRSIAISRDGRTLLTGSEDNTARLWDVETGQEIQQLAGHTDQVLQVAFSKDSRYALTGSADQTARLWDTETGQTVRQFVDHKSSVLFVAFASDDQHVITGDAQSVYIWRKTIEVVKAFACNQLSRDFTAEERALYNINDNEPSCTASPNQPVKVEPTRIPVPADIDQVREPVTSLSQPTPEMVEITLGNNAGLIRGGKPIQHVFVDAGLVVRPPGEADETLLAQPLYRAATGIEAGSQVEPFNMEAFEKGNPLGLTLGEWLAAAGGGTYTVDGDQAVLDLAFESLVPNGTYSLLCSEIKPLAGPNMKQNACDGGDGSASRFTTDEAGNGAIRLEMAALPPSTEAAFQQVALIFHSEEPSPAEVQPGYNIHRQLTFNFQPEHNSQDTVKMQFVTERQLGLPIQDAYLDAGLIVRPQDLEAGTLALPLYRSTDRIENDFMEAPYDAGPYERGEPLGFTLARWLEAAGRGTYTVNGNRAQIDLTLENLIPNGVYTLWCSEFNFPPVAQIVERPCGAPDGSENVFGADAAGSAEITVEIDAFPPSTKERAYVIAVAYHSDGQTYGPVAGDHGRNLHIPLIYEFRAPATE